MTKSELIKKVNEACNNSNFSFTYTAICSATSSFGTLLAIGGAANPLPEEYYSMMIGGITLAVVSLIGAMGGLRDYLEWKSKYKKLAEQL